MTFEKPKPQPRHKPQKTNQPEPDTLSKAIARPQKQAIPEEKLAETLWGRFALFCNHSYNKLIPQSEVNQRKQEPFAKTHRQCLEILNNHPDTDDWDTLLTKFSERQYKSAENFYFHLSSKKTQTPAEVYQKWNEIIKEFISLAELALNFDEERDLIKIEEFSKIIDQFGRSGEKVLWFLFKLPTFLEKPDRQIIESSKGYQELMEWGSSKFLPDLGLQLQRYFKITRTAIKDQTAQNLVRELGETEIQLKNEIQILTQENQELKDHIQQLQSQSLHNAVYQLAKSLQDQPQPILEQIFVLQQKLKKINQEGTPLSASDSLSCLIVLESILKALKELGITQYPTLDAPLELTADQLGEYTYINGSTFTDSEDKKLVRCISFGWKLDQKIITPAQVEEISSTN